MLSLLHLTEEQAARLQELQFLAQSINERLNLYSEESAKDFWNRHITHSLALACKRFPDGTRVVDWGTGGGIPGLPLAILFPTVEFVLIDAVGKKIKAVQTMARRLGLDNVSTWHGRAERWGGTTTYSVSRATSSLAQLWGWHCSSRVEAESVDCIDAWPPGLLSLKGGELVSEVETLKDSYPDAVVEKHALLPIMKRDYFRDKYILVVSSQSDLRTESQL